MLRRSLLAPPVRTGLLALAFSWGWSVSLVLALLAALPVQAAERKLAITDYTGTSFKSDGYGSVMASSGDWLAIAAPYKVTTPLISHRTTGRVLLWKRDTATGTWAVKQQIVCPVVIANLNDSFGSRMAMEGSTLLVSSHIGSAQSRVHVYRLDPAQDQWLPDGTLTPPGFPGADVGFGTALAVSGDLAAITSPSTDGGPVNRGGRSDLYQRKDGAWEHAAPLIDPDARLAENQGSSIAFRDGQILIGSPAFTPAQGRAGEGRIIIFSADGGTWTRTGQITPVTSGANQLFGNMLCVAGDTAHVAGSIFYTVITPTSSYRFTLSSQVNAIAVRDGQAAVLRDPSSRVSYYNRQADQGWAFETEISVTGQPRTAHYVGDELLLDGPSEYGRDRISSGVSTFRRSANALVRGPSLIPPEVLRVRHTGFGTNIASSGRWTALGSPYAPPAYESRSLGGLVFVYRGQTDGTHRFHSVLPDPVLPPELQMDRSLFGQQVAVGDSWIAVAATRKNTIGYASCPAVVLYRYDAGTNAWAQHSLITPPEGSSDQGFGHALSLSQDRALLIGAPGSRSACLYRLETAPAPASTQAWTLQHLFVPPASNIPLTLAFGHSVALDVNALVIGAPSSDTVNDGQAYIFELQDGTWRSFTRSSGFSSLIPTFGAQVSLSGDHAIVRIGTGGSARTFSRLKTPASPWQSDQLLLGAGPTPLMCTAAGSVAVIYQTNTIVLYLHNGNTWLERTSQVLPSRNYTSLTAMVMASGQLFTSSLTEVLVTDLATAPQLDVYTSSPTSTIQECLVGERIDDVYTLAAIGNGVVPVMVETTVEGDTDDFFIYGTRLVVQPGSSGNRFGIHFRPRTAGLKQLTLRRTTTIPGDQPQVTTLQFRAVDAYTPLRFTLEPVSVTTRHTLSARVEGTWPWSCVWYRNNKVVPEAMSPDYQPTLPGTYHVVFTNPAGSITSRKVSVSLVKLVHPADQVLLTTARQATWTIQTQGPGIRVEWGKHSSDGSEWTAVPGTRVRTTGTSSTLTLPAVPESAGSYSAYVYKRIPELGNEEISTSFPLSLHIVTLPVITSTPWDDTAYGIFTPEAEQRGSYDWSWNGPLGVAGFEGPRFSCTGLPPGITLDPVTGAIGGSTTRLGFYTTQARVRIGTLQSLPVTRRLAVVPSTVPGPGDYETILEHELLRQGIHVSLTVQLGGAFSGTFRTGTRIFPIAGVFRPRSEDDFNRPSYVFTLPLHEGPSQKAGLFYTGGNSIDVYTINPDTLEQREQLGYVNLIRPVTGLVIPCSQVGRHAVGFKEGSVAGSGYGSITIGTDGRLTFVGISPEGKALTASSWCHGGTAESTYAYFYATDKAGTVLRNYIGIPARERDQMTVHWSRLPQKGSLLDPPEVEDPDLTFLTSRVDARKVSQTFSSGYYAMDVIQGGLVQEERNAYFSLSSTLRASFGSGAADPLKARLDLQATTGFFTGGCTLRAAAPWMDYTVYLRTITFRGMFLPEQEIAIGQFLLPGVPNPGTSPPTPALFHPGQILITPMNRQ